MTTTYGDPKFDLRTLKRGLREGKVTKKDYEDWVKKLPDETKKSEALAVFSEKSETEQDLTFRAIS